MVNTEYDLNKPQYICIYRIYFGSDISVEEASILIVGFCNRFKLSNVAKDSFIQLIRCFLPINNKLPKTYDSVKKTIFPNDAVISYKQYCQSCGEHVQKNNQCTNKFCILKDNTAKSFNTMFSISIIPQLASVIKMFYNEILLKNTNVHKYYDLTDSSHYKMKEPETLQLMVYTDGLPITKKPSKSIWPVLCGLCDLPHTVRNTNRNKIIAGVWHGNENPKSDILFDSLIEDIRALKHNGLKVIIDGVEKLFLVDIYGIICDTPAKAKVMNMIQYNGNYGCPYCYDPGKREYSVDRNYKKRTNEDFKK